MGDRTRDTVVLAVERTTQGIVARDVREAVTGTVDQQVWRETRRAVTLALTKAFGGVTRG